MKLTPKETPFNKYHDYRCYLCKVWMFFFFLQSDTWKLVCLKTVCLKFTEKDQTRTSAQKTGVAFFDTQTKEQKS